MTARGLPAVARSAKAGLLAAAVLAALAALFAFKTAAKMPDFEVYWRAGARALAAEPLYREEDAHFRLKYLPAFAVLSIVGREAYARFMELSIISVCFLVVVAALTALRWRCAA